MFRLFGIVAVVVVSALAIASIVSKTSAQEPEQGPGAPARPGVMFSADENFPDAPSFSPGPINDLAQPAGMVCCGVDERVQISDTTQLPYRTVSLLGLYDHAENPLGTCTGTFIGPDTVLTAAHCLYNNEFGAIGDVVVAPGLNGSSLPYGAQFGSVWWVPSGWYASGGNPLYDWGIIAMPNSDLGSTVGWLTVDAMSTGTLSRGDFMPTIAGYPGDKDAGTMWEGAKPAFLAVNDFTLDFDIDAAHGESGSAIFSANPTEAFGGYVVGILSNATLDFNSGTRIEDGVLNDILSACNLLGCTISSTTEDATGTPTLTGSPTPTPTPTPTLSPLPTHSPTPTPAHSPQGWLQGDANCSSGIDIGDVTDLLQKAGGLVVPAGCPTYQDNVNCDNATDSLDALGDLLYLADAGSLPAPSGCTPIGEPLPV